MLTLSCLIGQAGQVTVTFAGGRPAPSDTGRQFPRPRVGGLNETPPFLSWAASGGGT